MAAISMLTRTLAVALLTLVSAHALAQAWPSKPVRIIVPYPAGGTSDILARTVSIKLSEMWGQSVIVGSAPHLAGIDFANRTGTQWAYIPYKGGAQAITDVVGGQADVLFNGMLATYPHVKSGKLKILAVSSAKRVPAIPDVPTVAESGVAGFETGSWQGVLAPPNTPAPVVAKMNADLIKVLQDPETRDKLAAQGAEVRTQTPEAMKAFISTEAVRWAKVVKDAGIKIE